MERCQATSEFTVLIDMVGHTRKGSEMLDSYDLVSPLMFGQ